MPVAIPSARVKPTHKEPTMKARLWVILALLLPLLLILLVFQTRPLPEQPPGQSDTAEPAPVKGTRAESGAVSKRAGETPAAFRWSQLEEMDLRKFIARLRGIGCPETTIQDIIVGKVNRQLRARLSAVRSEGTEPFWQTLERRTRIQEETHATQEAARRNIETERSNLIRELLGLDVNDYFAGLKSKPDQITRLLDCVSEPNRLQARQILDRFEHLEGAVYERCGGTLGRQEQVDLDRLYENKRRELQAVLTPGELEEFELRASPLSDRLRTADLVGFTPSEQEFRDIFRILRDLQGTATPDDSGIVQASQARLRSALGEKRFADYERAQDLTYRRLVEFAGQYGLGTDVAVQIHDLRENVLKQVDALAGQVPAEQLPARGSLSQIQADAAQVVRTILGDEAYSKYLTTQFGSWVNLIPTWTNGVVFRN